MMKLAQLEWMKLSRLNTMKIILGVYAVVVPLIYFFYSLLSIPIPIQGQTMFFTLPSDIYEFPLAYQVVAWTSSIFNLMLGVIIIVFTTNELKYKTQRQNMIDGMSKRQIIVSKLIVVVIFAAVISLFTFLVGLITGLMFSDDISIFYTGLSQIGAYFVATLGYFIFAFFLANLLKSPALAIIIYLLSTIVESILGYIVVQEYVQFFPLSSFKNLVPFPDLFPSEMDDDGFVFILDQGKRTLIAFCYFTIFVVSSYQILKRRDI